MVVSGLAAEIYPVKNGDFYYATDTGDLYIGTEGGNIKLRNGNKREWVGYVTIDTEVVTVQDVGINTLGETPTLGSNAVGTLTFETTGVQFISSPGLKFAVEIQSLTAATLISVNNNTVNSLLIQCTEVDGTTPKDCSLFIHITVWE